jgi:hypothetical protein
MSIVRADRKGSSSWRQSTSVTSAFDHTGAVKVSSLAGRVPGSSWVSVGASAAGAGLESVVEVGSED